MKELQKVFSYRGQQVRTVIINHQPWWVAKDVCNILELNTSEAVRGRKDRNFKDGLEYDEYRDDIDIVDGIGRNQKGLAVNEPGLYNLIFKSRKPEAKDFKRWVTHEVLPQIRQTGTYTIHQQFQIPQTYPEALRLAADLAEQNQRLKPKAEMHDLFLSADNNQPMTAVAKALGVGRNKLFAYLRDKGVLRRNNEPYQLYLDRGYFKVVEKPIVKGSRVENITQTFVTAKGVDFIGRLLAREEAI